MGSAVGRSVRKTATRVLGSDDTLKIGWVKPVDGNAPVLAECKKLKKKLPVKIVDLILNCEFQIKDFAFDPRFEEVTTKEPGVVEEARAGGSCYPVVAPYRNGLRRTVNLAWGTDIFVCSTGQSFQDVDTAMRCQNDYVKGVPEETLRDRYPLELIPV
eukprot:Skav207373  [mRNA]  locus=scaffold3618:142140:145389:- [translate_table: standard]